MKTEDQKLRKMEEKDYLVLAKIYFRIAKYLRDKKEHLRGVVDTAYNSAELCTKGLLIMKLERIPSTHGGVVQKFSQLYIKTKILRKDIGRILNRALRLRNIARYELGKEITKKDAEEVLILAKELIKVLEKKLTK